MKRDWPNGSLYNARSDSIRREHIHNAWRSTRKDSPIKFEQHWNSLQDSVRIQSPKWEDANHLNDKINKHSMNNKDKIDEHWAMNKLQNSIRNVQLRLGRNDKKKNLEIPDLEKRKSSLKGETISRNATRSIKVKSSMTRFPSQSIPISRRYPKCELPSTSNGVTTLATIDTSNRVQSVNSVYHNLNNIHDIDYIPDLYGVHKDESQRKLGMKYQRRTTPSRDKPKVLQHRSLSKNIIETQHNNSNKLIPLVPTQRDDITTSFEVPLSSHYKNSNLKDVTSISQQNKSKESQQKWPKSIHKDLEMEPFVWNESSEHSYTNTTIIKPWQDLYTAKNSKEKSIHASLWSLNSLQDNLVGNGSPEILPLFKQSLVSHSIGSRSLGSQSVSPRSMDSDGPLPRYLKSKTSTFQFKDRLPSEDDDMESVEELESTSQFLHTLQNEIIASDKSRRLVLGSKIEKREIRKIHLRKEVRKLAPISLTTPFPQNSTPEIQHKPPILDGHDSPLSNKKKQKLLNPFIVDNDGIK